MTGWSLGGPVIVPEDQKLLRNKLFFFFSEELVGSKVPTRPNCQTTPTALERRATSPRATTPMEP